jgi:hypothetical protein
LALAWVLLSALARSGAISPVAAQPVVVLNEIMYHPVEEPAFDADGKPLLDLYEDIHEFIELHNPSATIVNVSGWRLTGGVNFVFPAGALVGPNGFLVVAKDPARLAAVAAYGLQQASVLGPWIGSLSNEGETVRLRDAAGTTVEEVSYRCGFPWPGSADAFGAGDDWTGIQGADHQYRGRSLERVSVQHSADDPANWLASPFPGDPSPGRPNAVSRARPKPVMVALHAAQAEDGQAIIRAQRPVRIDGLFSSADALSRVRIEYFAEDVGATNEPLRNAPMVSAGGAAAAWYHAVLPGETNRAVVRYRIWADRGEGAEVVSPRADDPYGWHAYFVSPQRNSTNPVYELFISRRSITILSTNISATPRRVTRPDPPGLPRASWNATQPAIFVHEGVVYDVRIRHHGSQFRRDVARRSYKVQFPRYRLLNGHASVFLTDKDYRTAAGHAMFRAVGLPTSLTRTIDLYMNNDARLPRLEQEEYDEYMLARYHAEQARLNPGQALEPSGELYKAVGVFEAAEGPFGRAEGKQLPAIVARTNANLVYWTPLQRYEHTFALQNHGWRGHTAFKENLDKMWVARAGRVTAPRTNEIPALREFFQQGWSIDRNLTYIATSNYMVPWDDTIHNSFLWQQRDGRWSMLPWDFDDVLNGQSASGNIFTAAPFAGPNFFKESFLAAYREEFKRRIWWLNHTVLHPDNLAALGIASPVVSWARQRFTQVNRQAGLGVFTRPNRPTNEVPTTATAVAPVGWLHASAYSHSNNPAPAHIATTWQIRPADGSYYAPAFQLTTAAYLTSLPLAAAGLELGRSYAWKCTYTDADGRPSLASAETLFTIGPAPDPGGVVLNEIMADNERALANDGRYPDWVELFNPGPAARDLGGYGLTDNPLAPTKFLFPRGTVVPAGGFLVIWCDNAQRAPGLHTGFGLDRNGQSLALYAPANGAHELVDLVRFGRQLPDLTIARLAGAASGWRLGEPTPGLENRPQRLASPAQVRINEWMARPLAGDDWFEVYNPASLPVAIGGLAFSDAMSAPRKSIVPALSYLASGEFVRLLADGQPDQGAHHVGFQLNGAGGTLALFAADGQRLDAVLYGPQEPGVSQGRLPDGTGAVFRFPLRATPGGSNATDDDGDLVPDSWELAHGLDPLSAADGLADPDADRRNNLEEYLAGTGPRVAQAPLTQTEIRLRGNGEREFRFRIDAAPGKTYTVECRDDLRFETWTPVAQFPMRAEAVSLEFSQTIPTEVESRFYRVVEQP